METIKRSELLKIKNRIKYINYRLDFLDPLQIKDSILIKKYKKELSLYIQRLTPKTRLYLVPNKIVD